MSIPTRGVLYVHSAPSALCPHVEWAASGVLGASVDVDWVAQPAESGTYRAEISWQAAVGTAAALASALRGWERLRFEVTEEPGPADDIARSLLRLDRVHQQRLGDQGTRDPLRPDVDGEHDGETLQRALGAADCFGAA